MGTKKILISLAVHILYVCSTFGYSSRNLDSCVWLQASSQIGVEEATGKNDGPQVESYLASVGLKKGNPYCAAFLAWCLKKCNQKAATAFSPSWFPDSRVIMQSQKGWENVGFMHVFGLYFKNHNRIAHVGFIEKVTRTHVITIEANTSPGQSSGEADRNGDGVWRKRRMKKGIFKVSKWI